MKSGDLSKSSKHVGKQKITEDCQLPNNIVPVILPGHSIGFSMPNVYLAMGYLVTEHKRYEGF